MHQYLLRLFVPFILLLATTVGLKAQGNFDYSTACFHDETVSQKFTGATELTTCAGDGTDDRIQFTVSNLFMAFGYVVVDESGTIVHIGSSNFINFEMLPPGTLRVYAFSHFGFINYEALGENIDDAVLSIPCFDLTDNFVTVNNASPGAVMISTPSGDTEFNTCPGDGNPDVIDFLSDGTLPNTAFIVTDEDNVVLDINFSGSIDFDGAPEGICRVYAASYAGDLTLEIGDDLDDTDIGDACGGVSANFITVIRQGVIGGTVGTTTGDTEILTCPGDGVDDLVALTNTGGSGSSFVYVITDEENVILELVTGDTANFEGAPEGVCRIWGLSYEGNITANPGDDADEVDLTDACFALSANFITVVREVAEGGTIATDAGETEVAVCPGDGNPDEYTFSPTGAGGGDFTLVVTDTNNIIIAIPAGATIDFEDSGIGVCRVWGLSYQGELLDVVDLNAAEVDLATSCFDLSDNFVTVIRTVPSAGTVSTIDGETEVFVCPGDATPNEVEFVSVGSEGSNFTFLITDENNLVLSIPAGSVVDFNEAPPGVCRLWGLTYEGDLLIASGDDAATAVLATGCSSLSDNFVTVTRSDPEGGTVQTDQGLTEVRTCPGDGIEDIITFVNSGNIGPEFALLITDNDGNLIGTPPGGTVDFDSVEPGICRVYGLAYEGVITIDPDQNINDVALASGCFDLSDNFVTVNREPADGGTVSTEDGATEVTICPNDSNPDVISFDSTGTDLGNFTYLIVGDDGVVLGVLPNDAFDFNLLGPGVSRVYGLGYDGALTAGPGDSLGVDPLATECFALSDNFVTIIGEIPSGGTVSTEDGETEVFVCPGDMVADLIMFDSSGVGASGQYTYLVTDENNIILAIPEGDAVDFDGADFGTCRLWGLSYQGELLAQVDDDAANTVLATACFALSDNFVTVIRDDIEAGTVTTPSGADTVYTCPGDGNQDLVDVIVNDAFGGFYSYVITDNENVILDITTSSTLNFENAPEGICRIYGLSYAGDLLAQAGDDAGSVEFASGCFDLTENYITVVRIFPEGGSLSSQFGQDTVFVCGGDDTPDLVTLTVTNPSLGAYTFFIAQDSFILAELQSNEFDFNGAAGGTYQIFGLAYTGLPSLPLGANINDIDLATSCFDLADNAITVVVEEVDGCEIGVVGSNTGDFVYLCASNPNDGQLDFFSCSTVSDTNYQYVITTTDDVILFLMDGPFFDFGAIPLPSARVYAISYTGNLSPLVGQTVTEAELSDGCFDITDNFITVVNGQPEAGEISLAENTASPFCVANGNGTVVIETTSTATVGYGTIVTDPAGIVVQVNLDNVADFSDLPSGDYLIYGVSYTGNLTVQEGDDIDLVAIADNCFELSSPIDFFRADDINGGIVSNQFGTDTIYTCPMDGVPDILAVNTTSVGVPYRFLVTDSEGNIIIPESFSNIINFEDSPPGICRVYGYAFSGTITASFGDNIATAALSDSCFALSENYITVIRQPADGGLVATIAGDTMVDIDLGSDATTVTVTNNSMADLINYAYVITDDNNFVLGFGDGPTFDFAGAPAGVCRIWGLSYQGALSIEIGDDAANSELATGCFELSENFVTVNRGNGFGGENNYDGLVTNEVAMSAYPNPINGGMLQVIIESETELSDGQAYLRDQNGRTFANQFIAGGTRRANISFDVSQLPSGLLLVQYVAGDELRVIRVMRQ